MYVSSTSGCSSYPSSARSSQRFSSFTQLAIRRIYVNAEMESLLRLAPVVDTLFRNTTLAPSGLAALVADDEGEGEAWVAPALGAVHEPW